LKQVLRDSKLWDGIVVNLQVTDTNPRTMELQALVSARNASATWDLRCEVREKLVAFLQTELPESLPRDRADVRLPPRFHEVSPGIVMDESGVNDGSRRERA
jgi:hypothetical protein